MDEIFAPFMEFFFGGRSSFEKSTEKHGGSSSHMSPDDHLATLGPSGGVPNPRIAQGQRLTPIFFGCSKVFPIDRLKYFFFPR